jgi:hypothetical protein
MDKCKQITENWPQHCEAVTKHFTNIASITYDYFSPSKSRFHPNIVTAWLFPDDYSALFPALDRNGKENRASLQ